jgi:hypothetical protein
MSELGNHNEDAGRRNEWAAAQYDTPGPNARKRALDAALEALSGTSPSIEADATPISASRALRVGGWRLGRVATAAAALAIAAAATLYVRERSTFAREGDVHVESRTEIAIGGRARAALEPNARVSWSSPDDVTQSSGSVFYRVEPGATFRVHTSAGDVAVMGTCFRIKVQAVSTKTARVAEEANVNRRDIKSSAVGAVTAAVAFVGVYEGKVAVTHAGQTVLLTSGEGARLRAGDAPQKETDGAAAEHAFDVRAIVAGDDVAAKANRNLVHQLGDYRWRLDALTAQKAQLEGRLKKVGEQGDVSANDVSEVLELTREYDPTRDRWKELSKTGTVRYRLPCVVTKVHPWTPSKEELDALGLMPHDAATLASAHEHSTERVWTEIAPLCAAEVGSMQAATRVGVMRCADLIEEAEAERDRDGANEARRRIGEIRAGMQPMPGPSSNPHPLVKLYLALTGASKAFEDELAASFGPAEARRLADSAGMCMNTFEVSNDDDASKSVGTTAPALGPFP